MIAADKTWPMRTAMAKERPALPSSLPPARGRGCAPRLPKVMHKVGGLPMLGHVLAAAGEAGATRIAVVVGPDAGRRARLRRQAVAATPPSMNRRSGSARRMRCLPRRKELAGRPDDVLVLYGDTPLVTAATAERVRGRSSPRGPTSSCSASARPTRPATAG